MRCNHGIKTTAEPPSTGDVPECPNTSLPAICRCVEHASKDDLVKCVEFLEGELNNRDRMLYKIRKGITELLEKSGA